jgi:hypothetical protein
MSTVVSKNVQIGADGTASNNFTAYQPAAPDGTLRIGNGNSGSVTDAITLTSAGSVGIGTSSPTSLLQVGSTASSNNTLTVASANNTAAQIDLLGDSSATFGINLKYEGNGNYFAVSGTNAGTLTERMRIDASGNVGIGATSPTYKLTVQSGLYSILAGADSSATTLTDATQKVMRFGVPHYTNAEEPVGALFGSNTSTENNVFIGGGTGIFNAATLVAFYTAANTTTTTGSERMRINSAGSVGIGTASPASGYKLDVNGKILISQGDAEIRFNSGGGWIGNAATANTVVIGTSASERLRIDSAGNVGIGTSSPAAKFQVDSSSATYSANIRVRNSNFGNGVVGAASNILTVATDMNNIAFYTGSNLGVDGTSVPTNERLRIDSSGNVGIGTSSPNFGLSFGSNIGKTIALFENAGGSVYGIGMGGAGTGGDPYRTKIFSNGSERIAITDAGNVGIGTSSPDVALDVVGEAIIGNGTYGVKLSYSVGDTAGIIDTGNSADKLSFRIGNSEKARIDSSGNFQIGGTGNPARLNVVHASTYGVFIAGAAGSSTPIIFFSGATNTGSISTNGTSTSFNTSSDYRLKEDWVAVVDASTRVNALKPLNFAWIASGERVDGFLAHELAEVVPEAVTGEKDAVDAEGKPVYQGIDQSKLVPLLTAALQEALVKIESLTARVSALEGN